MKNNAAGYRDENDTPYVYAPNEPEVQAGVMYVYRLNLSKRDDQTLAISDGAARDSTNTNDIVLDKEVTVVGTGSAPLEGNQWYAVYVVGDSTGYKEPKGFLSLDGDSPIIAGGYDIYRRIGWIGTDFAGLIENFYQYGHGQDRKIYFDNAIKVLDNQGANTTFSPLDISEGVPPMSTEAIIIASSSSTGIVEFLPFGSEGTLGIVRWGLSGANGVAVATGDVPCQSDFGAAKILYKTSISGITSLFVSGYKDYLN